MNCYNAISEFNNQYIQLKLLKPDFYNNCTLKENIVAIFQGPAKTNDVLAEHDI